MATHCDTPLVVPRLGRRPLLGFQKWSQFLWN
jgi:hypothetical protein